MAERVQGRIEPSCVKRGPYLPIGDTDWVCVTHDVDLVRVAGEWGTQGKRDEMECPLGSARRAATAHLAGDDDG
jgi:hypothetical protein